jgi:transcriptional regulator with XRE-family HTH domain
MLDTENFYTEVGIRIRQAREEAGFSQQKLGTLVKLSRTSITNIELGRQKFLLHTLLDIALALKVRPIRLLPEMDTSLEKEINKLPQEEQSWVRSVVEALDKEEKE